MTGRSAELKERRKKGERKEKERRNKGESKEE
jgi:hypothetical protein